MSSSKLRSLALAFDSRDSRHALVRKLAREMELLEKKGYPILKVDSERRFLLWLGFFHAEIMTAMHAQKKDELVLSHHQNEWALEAGKTHVYEDIYVHTVELDDENVVTVTLGRGEREWKLVRS